MNECKIVRLFIRFRDLVIFVILDRSHRMHLFLSRSALLHHTICVRCSRIAWLRHTIYLRCSRIAWLRHLCKFIYDAPESHGFAIPFKCIYAVPKSPGFAIPSQCISAAPISHGLISFHLKGFFCGNKLLFLE